MNNLEESFDLYIGLLKTLTIHLRHVGRTQKRGLTGLSQIATVTYV